MSLTKHSQATGDAIHPPKVRVGLDADKGAPGWEGDAYYAHDTGTLYVGRGGAWEAVQGDGGGGGASALDDLSDVAIVSPKDGQLLVYDGGLSRWANADFDLDDLGDVNATSPNAGHTLRHTGAAWQAANLMFDDLYQVQDYGPPSDGHLIYFDGDNFIMGALPIAMLAESLAASPAWGDMLYHSGSEWTVGAFSLEYSTEARSFSGGIGHVWGFHYGDFFGLAPLRLQDLDAVEVSSLKDGQALLYDSGVSEWRNAYLDLGDLGDVSLGTLKDGFVLLYDAGMSTWQGGALDLNDLGDVDTQDVADGDVLLWSSSTGKWYVTGNGGLQLDDLTDVSAASLQDGYMLIYDSASSEWQAGYLSLGDAEDVNIGVPATGQLLAFGMGGKSEWENVSSIDLPAGGAFAIGGDQYFASSRQPAPETASTSHSITPPGDAPTDADALRDDLAANVLPDIEAMLDALGAKLNTLIASCTAHGFLYEST